MDLSSISTGLRPGLVGREAELRLVGRRLEEAANGRGSALFFVGEDGIGKTRLIDAVEDEALRREMLILRGAGARDRDELAYGCFIGVIRTYLQNGTPQERQAMHEAVDELAPHLHHFFTDLAGRNGKVLADTNPGLRQRFFLTRVSSLLLALSRRRPVILCLEDLHRADSASLRLAVELVKRSVEGCLMVVGTYRDGPFHRNGEAEGGDELVEALCEVYRCEPFQQVELGRFSPAQSRQLMESCFAPAEFGEDLVRQVHESTRGIPLLLVQSLESLREQGAIHQRRGVWMNRRVERVLPTSSAEVLERRLEGLSAAQRELLGYAAVQGESFEGGMVAELAGESLIHCLRELGRIERGTRMIRKEGREFRFVHPLLVEICYRRLPERRRIEAHLLVTEHLDADAQVERLAFHLCQAGRMERALPHLLEAGRRARAACALAEAQAFLERGLAVIGQSADPAVKAQRTAVLLELAELEGLLGEWILAAGRCREVLTLEAADGPCGKALLQLGDLRFREGAWEESARYCRAALRRFEATGDAAARATTLARMGRIELERSQLAAAAGRFEEARIAARTAGDPLVMGKVSCELGLLSRLRGRYLEGFLYCAEALQAFQKVGDRYWIGQTHRHLGALFATQEQWGEALQCYVESGRQARAMGAEDQLGHTLVGQALAQLEGGNAEGAEISCRTARAFLEQAQDRRGLAECNRVEGMVHRSQARYAPAEALLRQGKDLFLDLENRFGVAGCERELGLVLQQRGDLDGARRRLRDSSWLFAQVGAVEEARKSEELLTFLAA